LQLPLPAVAATAAPLADINGEDRGGDDSKGDDEGGKGGGGRGYEDGGDGGNDDAKRRQTQQPNIKPTSTARYMVAMTARATTKAARATAAGATRTTATMMTMAETAATMTPNGDKDNEDGICRRHQRRDIIHRSKSAGKRDRQLISRDGVTHVFPPLLGWMQASQAQSVSGKTEGMMDGCAGGGEVALLITGVQKTK
jgi:hypothetical protein